MDLTVTLILLAAAVAAIVLCVIGLAAFFFLPVRELPDVDPPIVSVNTSYAGASAEVIESRITEPIEQQIAGIQAGTESARSRWRTPTRSAARAWPGCPPQSSTAVTGTSG